LHKYREIIPSKHQQPIMLK